MSNVVAGLDLSLRCAAMIAVRADWDGDWSLVDHGTIEVKVPKGASELDRAMRLHAIATAVVKFCAGARATDVAIEGYAFDARYGREALGELGGVVRVYLALAGFKVNSVPPTAARKLLLGKVPKKLQKTAVQKVLMAAGAPRSWVHDEYDAFVVANWLLGEIGGYCFATPEDQ